MCLSPASLVLWAGHGCSVPVPMSSPSWCCLGGGGREEVEFSSLPWVVSEQSGRFSRNTRGEAWKPREACKESEAPWGGFGITALPLAMGFWDGPAQLTVAGNTEPLFYSLSQEYLPWMQSTEKGFFPLTSTGKKGGRGGLSSFFIFFPSFNSCCVNLSYSFVFLLWKWPV